MPVAGDNQIGLPGQGAGEYMVVIRVMLNHARHVLGSGRAPPTRSGPPCGAILAGGLNFRLDLLIGEGRQAQGI